MAEKEKIDINIPIEAKIKATKGIKLGDDLVNPLEKKLLDEIIVEHGEAMASTREAMNADFSNLLEDVADLSEGNQRQLREVSEMLGVTLKTKDGGLQMDYALFQAILKFQKENKMKLTGIVDSTLHAALKEKMGKKPAENPEKPTSPAAEKKETPYTGYTPVEETKTREETIQSIAEKPYINSNSAYPVGPQTTEKLTEPVATAPTTSGNRYKGDDDRILPPPIPPTPTGIASKGAQAAEKVAPTVATQPANTPPSAPTEAKPVVKALPVEEAAEKTAEVEQVITEEAKKLGITIDDINLAQSPFGQSIVDMILYYESGEDEEKYVRRKSDIGGADIGGGINTGSSREELTYALGGTKNYETWRDSKIPTIELVKQSVQRLLHSRIAVTRKSCAQEGIPDFDALPQNVKAVLIDLHYNMPNNIHEFTKFWDALRVKDWQEAGRQLVDSGSGSPSKYLNQTGGRAYANALGLSTDDVANHRANKKEVEKMTDSAAILGRYREKVKSKFGDKVGMRERKDIVKNAENAGDILAQTTSIDVLKTKGSTKSVTKILDKYIQEHPEERAALIAGLVEKIGNFSRPLQTTEEVGAFQQLVYLSDPVRFAAELRGIDGDYGSLTSATYMKDIYAINGTAMLAKITDAASITQLTPFEQEVLKKNLSRDTASVGAGSSAEEIRKAQILLALNGELGGMAIDGKWSPELEKLMSIPSLSSEKQFLTAEEARAILSRKYKIISSTMDDDPGDSKATNRTGLVGLRHCAVGGAMNLAKALHELGYTEDLVITGGTEAGHSLSGDYTHEGGYKLDFRVTLGLEKFTGLTKNGIKRKRTMEINGQTVKFFRHEPDHFDVTFVPTK